MSHGPWSSTWLKKLSCLAQDRPLSRYRLLQGPSTFTFLDRSLWTILKKWVYTTKWPRRTVYTAIGKNKGGFARMSGWVLTSVEEFFRVFWKHLGPFLGRKSIFENIFLWLRDPWFLKVEQYAFKNRFFQKFFLHVFLHRKYCILNQSDNIHR